MLHCTTELRIMKKNNVGIWQPGKIIYNYGDPPEFAYLIVDGIVEFFSEKNVLLGNAGTSLKIPKPSAFQIMAHVGSFKQSSILNPQLLENTAESKRYLYFVAFIFC